MSVSEKDLDRFSPPVTEEEAVMLKTDWTPAEELQAKRK
jgi:hypothetical protein